MSRILLVDNYDSFTYNLAHLFGSLGAQVDVVRNDDSALTSARVEAADGVVIGPGPGRPAESGRSLQMIGEAVRLRRPLFGVCLGQQAIGEFYGGQVVHAPSLMHGKTSSISHEGTGLFAGVPNPFVATRYHSLCVDRASLPAELVVTASSEDRVVQGIAHRQLPVVGVQFHPESVMTAEGGKIFANFLMMTKR